MCGFKVLGTDILGVVNVLPTLLQQADGIAPQAVVGRAVMMPCGHLVRLPTLVQIQRTAHKVSHGLQVLGLHHRLYPAVRQQRLHQPCRMAIIGKPASRAVAPQFGKHLVTGVNVCVGNHPMHLGQKFQVNICTPIKAVHIPAQSPRP